MRKLDRPVRRKEAKPFETLMRSLFKKKYKKDLNVPEVTLELYYAENAKEMPENARKCQKISKKLHKNAKNARKGHKNDRKILTKFHL